MIHIGASTEENPNLAAVGILPHRTLEALPDRLRVVAAESELQGELDFYLDVAIEVVKGDPADRRMMA